MALIEIGRLGWILALVGLLMLGVLGWLAPQIIRIAMDQGEIVIATSDDNVEVRVLQDGEVVQVIDTKTQQSFSLKSGQYSFNAVAKDLDNDNGNSFTIEPKTLTMKRGDKAIVSVTVEPEKNTDPQVAPIVKNNLVYQGNTFDQWIRVLQSTRDYQAQVKSLEACLAGVETQQEQKEILEGVRTCLKRLDGRLANGSFFATPLYMLVYRVLDSCDPPLVFDFLKAEIASGSGFRQKVSVDWIRSSNARASVVFDRLPELIDTFAENFDKAPVRELAEYLTVRYEPDARARETPKPDDWLKIPSNKKLQPLTRFQGSAFGEKVREFIQTATLQQRLELFHLVFGIFPDDRQLLRKYQTDLLDPKLNKVFVNLNGGRMWQPSKNILFEFMLKNISNKTYYESSVVSGPTRQQRLATAADWLAKVVDGSLAAGDQRLKFSRVVATTENSVRRIENGTRALQERGVRLFTSDVLQSFYNIGRATSDPEIKQLLLTKLEMLKESIVNEKDIANDEDRTNSRDRKRRDDEENKSKSRLVADLNYVIAFYQGNTPAELPPNSRLKVKKSE